MVHAKFLKSMKAFLGASLLALSLNVEAAPLDLTLLDSPDVASFFITSAYDSSSGMLMATGMALSLDTGAAMVSMIDPGGMYILQASIDNSGNLLGGSIELRGTIASLGHTSGTLLTGTLTDFGFGIGGPSGTVFDPLEFLFTPTGGDLAPLYGALGGIIMSGTGFNGSFAENFGDNSAVADVAAIPVPAALWLMMSALAGLISVRKR